MDRQLSNNHNDVIVLHISTVFCQCVYIQKQIVGYNTSVKGFAFIISIQIQITKIIGSIKSSELAIVQFRIRT